MTTYQLCLRLINAAKKKGILNKDWLDDMKKKIDVFYAADRLTESQYKELIEKITISE